MYARITEDLLYEDGDDIVPNREGMLLYDGSVPTPENTVKLRLLDDDRIPYYIVVCDEEAEEPVFNWGHRDSGVTLVQIWKDNKWEDYMS